LDLLGGYPDGKAFKVTEACKLPRRDKAVVYGEAPLNRYYPNGKKFQAYTHLLFRYRLIKNGLVARKVSGAFEKQASESKGPD